MKWSKIKERINETVRDNDEISTIKLNFNIHTDIEIDIDRTDATNRSDTIVSERKNNSTKSIYAIRSVNEDIMEGLGQENKW